MVTYSSDPAHYMTPLSVMVGAVEDHPAQVYVALVDAEYMKTVAATRMTPEMARFIARLLLGEADAADHNAATHSPGAGEGGEGMAEKNVDEDKLHHAGVERHAAAWFTANHMAVNAAREYGVIDFNKPTHRATVALIVLRVLDAVHRQEATP